MTLPPEAEHLCQQLGLRLRQARVVKKETQADLGVRAGVSRQLIIKMEQGDPSVALEKWVKVSLSLDLMHTWQEVLRMPADPFAEYDRKIRREQGLRTTRVRKR